MFVCIYRELQEILGKAFRENFWTWKWRFWKIVKIFTGIFGILICAPSRIGESFLEGRFSFLWKLLRIAEKKCWIWKWGFWELKTIYGVFGMFVCIYRELQEILGKIFLNLKMAILGNRKSTYWNIWDTYLCSMWYP